MQNVLTEEGNIISRWYEQNLLKCNHDKFQLIRLGLPKQSNKELNITIKNYVVKSSSEINLLGVIFDDQLCFDIHVKELSKRVARKVEVLMRLRDLLPTSAKLKIYETFILSDLTYCQIIWHFCRLSDSRKLDRLQERAFRAIHRDKSSRCNELLVRAKRPSTQ